MAARALLEVDFLGMFEGFGAQGRLFLRKGRKRDTRQKYRKPGAESHSRFVHGLW
jgi:hypothetical protein